jgi:hypothetical protein
MAGAAVQGSRGLPQAHHDHQWGRRSFVKGRQQPVRAEVGVWQLVWKRWSWAGGDASVCCFADRMEMGRQLPIWGEGEVASHTIVREEAEALM